jgi:DNA-binding NtrC family response regulator
VETGEQALEILGRGEPRVDAMLLDLTLPGIPGEAVLREVHRTAPHLPIVIASGYATMESQAAWMEAGAVGFVAKPFHIQQVAQRLREALDRPSTQAR